MAAFTDNFTGSDTTTPPNSDWTNFTVKGIEIRSNGVCSVTNGAYGFAFVKVTSYAAPADQEASCTILAGRVGGPMVRASEDNGYWMDCNDSGGGNTILWKRIAGTNTVLLNLSSTSFANGDKAKLKIVGNTLQMFRDTGSGFVQIGSDQPSGGELTTGQFGVNALSGGNPALDDFIGDAAGGSGGGGVTLVQLEGFPRGVLRGTRRFDRSSGGPFMRADQYEQVQRAALRRVWFDVSRKAA